jgi:hypothetical protein
MSFVTQAKMSLKQKFVYKHLYLGFRKGINPIFVKQIFLRHTAAQVASAEAVTRLSRAMKFC